MTNAQQTAGIHLREEAKQAAAEYKGNKRTLKAFKDTINYLFNNRVLAVRVQYDGLFQAMDHITDQYAHSREQPSIWTTAAPQGVSNVYVLRVIEQANKMLQHRNMRHQSTVVMKHLLNLLECYKEERSVGELNKRFVQELTYMELVNKMRGRSERLFSDTVSELGQALKFFNMHTPELEQKLVEEMKYIQPQRFFFMVAHHFEGSVPQEFIDSFSDDLHFLANRFEMRQRIVVEMFERAELANNLAPFDNVSDLRKFLVTDVELPIVSPNPPEEDTNPQSQEQQ